METLVILQAIALIILATASLVLFKDFKDANQKLQTLSSRIRAAASLRLGGVEYFLQASDKRIVKANELTITERLDSISKGGLISIITQLEMRRLSTDQDSQK